MATLRDVRRRIRTVRNIQEITKALKMVAAARLQKAESRAKAARPYAEEMVAVMGHLAASPEYNSGDNRLGDNRLKLSPELYSGDAAHPLLEVREPVNVGIMVITSDRGMAGSYNTNIIRRTMDIAGHYDKEHVKLVTVGKKGRAFFGKQGYTIAADYSMPSSEVTIAEARVISRAIRDLFDSRELDLVHVVYTRFLSAISQRVTDQQLLPVTPPESPDSWVGSSTPDPTIGAAAVDYIFEPEPAVLLGRLLPRYVDVQVYRAMMESLASEHGARMTSMSTATENAGEMIQRLTLDFNRARQSQITRELIEIVSGAEALK